ncbi:MAG: hypothetical protein WBM55_01250 [Muriicola sp.]
MKNYLSLFACFLFALIAQANCTNAYSTAGYSLSHAKKSMSANNFEHQQYYAERALIAFEKAKAQIESCGCQASMNPALEGIKNLEASLSQTKWDMGRFYTKKAVENAHQLLESLDMCSLDDPQEFDTGSNESLEPEAKEMQSLEDQIAKEHILEEQLNFKRLAEMEIADLENSIRELATLFQCDKALHILKDRKSRTEEELQAESLDKTKAYYRSQVVAIHNKALFALIECSKDK